MIGKVKKWINKQFGMIGLALSNVEKEMLGQASNFADGGITTVRRHRQGSLADALVRGELTQSVK